MAPVAVPRQLVLISLSVSALISQTYAIVSGVQGNGVGTRREIRDLLHDDDAWNVYVLGLSSMQNASQSDASSYYSVAGIHGLPVGPYDGYTGVADPAFGYGFCTHDSNYFPPWHRAYLALYEQTLQKHALQEAMKFKGEAQTRYVKAANSLRSPYLDWTQNATGGTAFPNVFDHPTARAIIPHGQGTAHTVIPNPLYAYRFNPVENNLVWDPYTHDGMTSRYPQDPNTVNSPSNQVAARAAIDSISPALHDRLYKVLTNYTDYNTFSNDAWIPHDHDVNLQDSLESIHNDFHNFVGGPGGFMPVLPASAYDPIFWVHHTMVDRSVALWQALHPDSWLQPQSQVTPSYWYNVGDYSSSSTGLKPFAKDASHNLWTPDELRDWTVLGYTYPELQPGWTSTSVRAAIDKLYSNQEDPAITAAAPQTTKKKRSSFSGHGFSAKFFKNFYEPESSVVADVTEDLVIQSYEYFINVRASKFALLQPYWIFAFFGEPPADSNTWTSAPNLAGMMGVAAPLLTVSQAAKTPTVFTASTIPLNRALKSAIRSGTLTSSSHAIESYLTANLNWLVLANNGTLYEAGQVPGLLISVGQTVVHGTSSTNLVPDVTNGRVHKTSSVLSGVTQGKSGGLCSAESGIYKNTTTT